MNERNLNEGQWEDRKQWSLGVRQRRKTFWTRYIHTYNIKMTGAAASAGSVAVIQCTGWGCQSP